MSKEKKKKNKTQVDEKTNPTKIVSLIKVPVINVKIIIFLLNLKRNPKKKFLFLFQGKFVFFLFFGENKKEL